MGRRISLILLLVYIGSEFIFQDGSHQFVVLLLFVWLASVFFCSKWRVGKELLQKRYICAYIFLFYYFISTYLGSTLYKASTSTLLMIRIFSPILMYDILRNETYKTKRFVTYVFMAYVLGYAFWSNMVLNLWGNEEGLRISLNREEGTYIETMFYYVYCLPILVATLAFILKVSVKSSNKLWLKMALLLMLLYLFYISLSSYFMTSIAITIFGVVLAFFINRDISFNKTIFKTLVAVIVCVMAFFAFGELFQGLVGADNSILSMRLEEIKGALTGNLSEQSDLGIRGNFRTVSIVTFISNPVFGVNHLMVGIVDNSIIGNHAQWFDDLARYGIFAILIFVFLYKAFKKQYQDTKIALPWIIYLLIGCLNPLLHPVTSICYFVIVPLMVDTLIERKNCP